jgi:rare lipoprotein A
MVAGRGLGTWLALCLLIGLASGCGKRVVSDDYGRNAPKGTFKPYTINGQTYYPLQSADGFTEVGVASWYGRDFHGRSTSSGEPYNMYAMTGAHKILPMHTRLQVTNLENGRRIEIRVNDRGPFVQGRILDLSRKAADELDISGAGTARVRIEAIGGGAPAPREYDAPSSPPRNAPGVYYVQVAAYTDPDQARWLSETLRQRGYPGGRVQSAYVGGRNYWRVQLGAFNTMNAANSAQGRLEREFPSSFVIVD